VDALYKGFTIHTDQPVKYGGDGSAPAPFDLFLASIGTCAGFYVQKFLESRGLSTDGVHIDLVTVKDPERKMLSEISLRVVLPENFPRKYERAIVAAVNQCSVKQHIAAPPQFPVVVQIGNPLTAAT
jgi:ribosomal protein S12 methylthiotransferase accessory factor